MALIAPVGRGWSSAYPPLTRVTCAVRTTPFLLNPVLGSLFFCAYVHVLLPNNSLARPLSPHETSMETREQPHAINLSLDGLAMLGRIHVARVLIDSLKIPPEGGSQSTPGKTRSTGKPPRPHLAKKRSELLLLLDTPSPSLSPGSATSLAWFGLPSVIPLAT